MVCHISQLLKLVKRRLESDSDSFNSTHIQYIYYDCALNGKPWKTYREETVFFFILFPQLWLPFCTPCSKHVLYVLATLPMSHSIRHQIYLLIVIINFGRGAETVVVVVIFFLSASLSDRKKWNSNKVKKICHSVHKIV